METQQDAQLAVLLDQLSEQVALGNTPDIAALCGHDLQLAEQLKRVWGAVLVADAVAEHSRSPRSLSTDGHPTPIAGGEPPRLFGDYELIEVLGEGGMGVVYKARQISLDRLVALKFIRGGSLASPASLVRFESEARAAAGLEHSSIVPIFEVGQVDGQPYLAMQLIQGQTLARLLEKGPVPPRRAARILHGIAAAVDVAHRNGILHRDLKPANILLDEHFNPHVTDFGLAKSFLRDENTAQATQPGAILGTPTYMSPEQAAGNRGELGPVSDVYSLGAILYAMLTGRPPFQGASAVDTVLMVLEQDPVPPRMLSAKVDRDLEMVALKCLQKPQELRYATAGEVVADLKRYLEGSPLAARSGRLSDVIARLFRESHHATVLENWGLLWMWHALILLVLCVVTNWFHTLRLTVPQMNQPLPYVLLWGGGLAVWAPIFWAVRCRAGPVTAVERQIAHVWGASIAGVVLLFVVEYLLGQPVLTLSPVLGLIGGMVFIVKAGTLAGRFYWHAAALFATAIAMAALQVRGFPYGITLFGIVSAATFFLPGWKYRRQSRRRAR